MKSATSDKRYAIMLKCTSLIEEIFLCVMIVTRQNIVACIMHNLFFNSTDEQSVLLPQLKMLDNISMFFGKVQGNMPWAYVFVCCVICLRDYESIMPPIRVIDIIRKTATV